MYKFENDELNHLTDIYGDELDLSNGYKDNDTAIPLSLLKAYQNHPLGKEIIKDIKECFVTRDTFVTLDHNKNLCCKFCGTNKFLLKYKSYGILAQCPSCLWQTSAYSE